MTPRDRLRDSLYAVACWACLCAPLFVDYLNRG